MRNTFRVILMAAFCTAGNAAIAQVVYDNGNHVQTGALADAEYLTGPAYHEADDFVLATGETITQITWKGFYLSFSPVDDNFEILIYADDGSGQPTSPVTSTQFTLHSPQ